MRCSVCCSTRLGVTVEGMARKPRNVQWLGFTDEQSGLLDFVDHLGNNGWARNSQSDAIMTKMLGDVSTLA